MGVKGGARANQGKGWGQRVGPTRVKSRGKGGPTRVKNGGKGGPTRVKGGGKGGPTRVKGGGKGWGPPG